VNTCGSPIQVVIYLEDIVYPGGYKGKGIADFLKLTLSSSVYAGNADFETKIAKRLEPVLAVFPFTLELRIFLSPQKSGSRNPLIKSHVCRKSVFLT
jgi:hypothetical protein